MNLLTSSAVCDKLYLLSLFTDFELCYWQVIIFGVKIYNISSSAWTLDSPLSACWLEPLRLQRESFEFYQQQTEQQSQNEANITHLSVKMISLNKSEEFKVSLNGFSLQTHVLCRPRDDVQPVVSGFDVNPLKHKTHLALSVWEHVWVFSIISPAELVSELFLSEVFLLEPTSVPV